jgi:hypothetical protein
MNDHDHRLIVKKTVATLTQLENCGVEKVDSENIFFRLRLRKTPTFFFVV